MIINQKESLHLKENLLILFKNNFEQDILDILNNEENFGIKDVELIYDYFEDKLNLYSNLKPSFDEISSLKDILLTYLVLYDRYKDKIKLKEIFRKKLMAIISSDKELIEFLLLIAEKVRYCKSSFEGVSDEKIGEYYFDIYKSDKEKRFQTDFTYYLKHNNSFQTDKNRIIEETVMRMIAKSRSYFLYVRPATPVENKTLRECDDYFQKSFQKYFKIKSPLLLSNITNFSNDFNAPYADRISKNIFIDENKNKNELIHLMIHEGMHLCFKGFNERVIEEGLIEYFIENMYKNNPSNHIAYTPAPVSDAYNEWKKNIKLLFEIFSDLERYFVEYFIKNNSSPLIEYMKQNITDEIIEKKLRKNYCFNDSYTFMNGIRSLRDSKSENNM